MEKATAASKRAQTLISQAKASSLPASAFNIIKLLLQTFLVAEEARSQALPFSKPETSPEPQVKQTSEDGTVLEQHEKVQIQRTKDGQMHLMFKDILNNQAVVVYPSDLLSQPIMVQVGESGKEEQIQFMPPNHIDAACFQQSGEVLQVLLSAGGVLVVKINGDVVQIVPPDMSAQENKPTTPTTPTTPSQAIQLFLDAATTETPYMVVLRFESEASGDLKGCTFKPEQINDTSILLEHQPNDIIEKSHWTKERLICVFRDGTMCERRADGRVLVVEKLDDAIQSAMTGMNVSNETTQSRNGTVSTLATSFSSSSSSSVDDIDFSNNGNKTELVKTLKGKQLGMAQTKVEMTTKLKSAYEAYEAAATILNSANEAKKIADVARKRCLQLANVPVPTNAEELAKEGTLMQEETGEDGIKTIMVILKNGTQRQIQDNKDGKTKTINVAMSDVEEVVVKYPESLTGCLFQQTVPIVIETGEENQSQTIIMFKTGAYAGTQVMHQTKNNVLEHIAVVRDGRQIQFKVKDGAVEVVSIVGKENGVTVQMMMLTVPKRIAVIYETGLVRLCQITDPIETTEKKKPFGLVVLREGGSKCTVGKDGTFTVEQTKESGASSVLQLGIDGHLLIIKADGSQWRFTGNELHAMQQVSINSPRGKLQAAKLMDAELNK